MTDPHDDEDPELSALACRALSRQLIPTTEDEVRRAEAAGEEFTGELPENLRQLGERAPRGATEPAPQSARVISLADERARRFGWGTHLVAVALGAAAASVLFVVASREPQPTPATGASAEPRVVALEASVDARAEAPIVLPDPESCGAACCAGKECKAAKADLRECPSGRGCIPCRPELTQARYRARVSALTPLGDAARVLASIPAGSAEACLRAGAAREECVVMQAEGSGAPPWTSLALPISAQDLIAGLQLRIVARGVAKPLAEWQSPVPVSPTLLCRGLSLRPKAGEVPFGVISVFLDDAYFVEIDRAVAVAPLLTLGQRIDARGAALRVFETRRQQDRGFSLVLGPMEHGVAEKHRWTLLEAGLPARVTLGEDHVGEPRAIER